MKQEMGFYFISDFMIDSPFPNTDSQEDTCNAHPWTVVAQQARRSSGSARLEP